MQVALLPFRAQTLEQLNFWSTKLKLGASSPSIILTKDHACSDLGELSWA